MSFVKQPKTQRGELTLRKICKAAEELFAEKGYYATEIHDITQKAQVATGTLYVYFPDKLSLFLHLMDELGRKLRREIRAAKQKSPDSTFIEQERISIRVFFGFVREHFGLFRIVWQAQFVDEQAFKGYYERFARGYVAEITKANESGEARDLDPTVIAYALMGIYSFVALKCFVFDKSEPDEATIEQLVEFIARGICGGASS
ncbi:MAG: TetR/AcrR family transcriptional regulator [Defluviitaleaceae bacterium]|nr:TetR/AcrR family transcriptional regulator [Defluviitaleaceae bacterium]